MRTVIINDFPTVLISPISIVFAESSFPKCNSETRVISVITSLYEISKILRPLAKTGKSPP